MLSKKVASIAIIAIILFLTAAPDILAQNRCRGSRNSRTRYYDQERYYNGSQRRSYDRRRGYYGSRRDGLGSKGRAALTIAGPAAIGAGVGALIGGGKGAAVGALLGGGGGAIYYLSKNKKNRRRY